MRLLSIDLETYSSIDLVKCGVYKYTEAEDFQILLFAYAFDDELTEIIDLAYDEEIPDYLLNALTDTNIIKTAFNANFERTCLSKYLKKPMPPEQWRCSAAHALTLGLPGNLAGVANCLKLPQQKMSEGKALIRYFSMPCKPTKSNEERTRNLPKHDMEKWEVFKTYCKQDVEVERSIRKKLELFPMTDKEWALWCLDQRINDGGVKVDKVLVFNAIKCDEAYKKKISLESKEITNLDNANSPTQLKEWFLKRGIEIESLSKEKVKELLNETQKLDVKRVLELRQELSKTSVKKYEAMERALCKDNRVRGLMQYYGANRSGRWAGRLVQVQNLPRNKMENLSDAGALLKVGQFDMLELLFDSVPDVLSQLIRTAFIPSENSRFIVSDFSAIEARVIAWLAEETWVIETFKSHGKIYEMAASKMFNVPIDKIAKGNTEYELRQKGKIAVLACGYQGSVGALVSMGALKMGLKEEELPEIVKAWRESNPKIVKLWSDVEKAAIEALEEMKVVSLQYGLKFFCRGNILFVKLPSGRSLAYARPKIETDSRFNKKMITYEGIEQGSKQWGRISTFGGKLVENLVQAIARDCLAESMLNLYKAGYKTVFHVHDEVILDVPIGFGSLEEVEEIMGWPIEWAPGLPLKAASFETPYYKKD